MTLAVRLLKAMQEKGLTQASLGERAGISQQSIHQILSGKTRQPKAIVDIAMAVGKPVEWLLFGNEHAELLTLMYPIPVITFTEVALWRTEETRIRELARKEEREIPMHVADYQKCYAVKVQNDLMVSPDVNAPSLREGETLIIDPSEEPRSGDFVAAHEEGAPEAILRKYIVDGGQKLLFTLKPSILPVAMGDKFNICGVIVARYNIHKFREKSI